MSKIPEIKKELWNAYDAYLAALEEERETDERVTPLLDKLAKSFGFKKTLKTRNGKLIEEGVIEKAKDIYLASDEDAEKFYRESAKLYSRLGYKVDMYYCPVLVSRSKRIDAMHKFVDESFYLVASTGLKKEGLFYKTRHLNQYVDTTIKLLKTIKRGV